MAASTEGEVLDRFVMPLNFDRSLRDRATQGVVMIHFNQYFAGSAHRLTNGDLCVFVDNQK